MNTVNLTDDNLLKLDELNASFTAHTKAESGTFKSIGKKLRVGQKITMQITAIDEESKLKFHHKTAVEGLLKKIERQKAKIERLGRVIEKLVTKDSSDDEDNAVEGLHEANGNITAPTKTTVIKVKRSRLSLLNTASRASSVQVQASRDLGSAEEEDVCPF